jgi:mannosyltransferase
LDSQRINATIIALVRNHELDGMVQSIRELEQTWNHKFNYPWIFFNDEPFDDEFKRLTQNETKSECIYELIPKEHWEAPQWIDEDRFEQSLKELELEGVRYGGIASYYKMCRWNSGFFYKHQALTNYKWYWRVEPNVHFFCDIDYDVFAYMQDNNKTYGFTISVFDSPQSVWTLWPATMKFVAEHPEYMHSNNSLAWLTDGEGRPEDWMANGYSTCHFWSNFEIGDMDFWRSRTYEDYFNHLDRAGGFFYERWGDAPVHSVALGLFEDASRLHWYVPFRCVVCYNEPN